MKNDYYSHSPYSLPSVPTRRWWFINSPPTPFPHRQGFTQSGSGSSAPASTNYLSEAAWFVEDADESNIGYQYNHTITADDVSTLQSRGYRVSARVAFLDTTYNDSNSCNFSFSDGSKRFLSTSTSTAAAN